MATNGTNGHKASPTFDTSSTIPLWLDGKQITTSTTFEVTSPVDHKVLYKCSSASEDDAIAAVEAAQRAFPAWSKTKPNTRRDILLKAAEILASKKDECFKFSSTETGALDSMFSFEHNLAVQGTKSVAGLIQTVTGTMFEAAEEGMNAFMVREAYGVCLGIAPWNAPHVLGCRAFLQPLAMGNTVVLKGPEASPGTYWAIDAFQQAGLPPGVLNTIYHRPADAAKVTNALISHPSVKKINFTGSTNVGAIIASLSGKYLKPCVMELGGKAPSIVCEDANLQTAALQCALGAFLHAGQICMAAERVIVHKKVEQEFKEAFKGTIDAVFKGEAMNLVSHIGVEKNKKLLADAISKGAKTIYGDAEHNTESKTTMKPVVIENVTPEMDIYHTESFGPTVSVITVDSDEEAVRIANDTEYGLSSSVFTEDLKRGIKIAKQLETGAVHINSMTIHDEAALPHGGVKRSGFGRFNGREGLEEWVRTKIITWMD